MLLLTEAALIGVCGGLLGLLFGGALVHHLGVVGLKLPRPEDATLMNEFHPYITASYMIRILLVAVFGAVGAAFYPARRASRLRPIEALSEVAT